MRQQIRHGRSLSDTSVMMVELGSQIDQWGRPLQFLFLDQYPNRGCHHPLGDRTDAVHGLRRRSGLQCLFSMFEIVFMDYLALVQNPD